MDAFMYHLWLCIGTQSLIQIEDVNPSLSTNTIDVVNSLIAPRYLFTIDCDNPVSVEWVMYCNHSN